ncbi:hypothetical protein, partial [Salmonella enterica]|uniref:hypothetical protein n=1 Tax=Salmonella enterica TaxID=28901 RepID=UPI0035254F59
MPNETKILDTGIEFYHNNDINIEINTLDGWNSNNKIIINTNLVRNTFEEGEKISIQNITDNELFLSKGTALVKAEIINKGKTHKEVEWEEWE